MTRLSCATEVWATVENLKRQRRKQRLSIDALEDTLEQISQEIWDILREERSDKTVTAGAACSGAYYDRISYLATHEDDARAEWHVLKVARSDLIACHGDSEGAVRALIILGHMVHSARVNLDFCVQVKRALEAEK